jgi:hypothetical protein
MNRFGALAAFRHSIIRSGCGRFDRFDRSAHERKRASNCPSRKGSAEHCDGTKPFSSTGVLVQVNTDIPIKVSGPIIVRGLGRHLELKVGCFGFALQRIAVSAESMKEHGLCVYVLVGGGWRMVLGRGGMLSMLRHVAKTL